MFFKAFGFLILYLLPQCDCGRKSYKNHALLRGVPYNDEELMFYKTLDRAYNVIWWKEPTLVHNKVEFSIAPSDLARLYRETEGMSIRFAVVIRNVQRCKFVADDTHQKQMTCRRDITGFYLTTLAAAAACRPQRTCTFSHISMFDKQEAGVYFRRNLHSFNWHTYYRLEDIYDWLKDLSIKYSSEVQLHRVGLTHENRTILSARLKLAGSAKRSKVIVEGGIHGREWMSPAFVTYMLYTLLNARTYKDEELERIALLYTWIFIPVMNPDGYEYSHTGDRMWRKNRRPKGAVDLNRNYGIDFGNQGTSRDPLNAAYCGESAFSEPETYAVSTLARGHRQNLEYYIAFHSYGQYFIIPYAYTMEHEDNYYKMKEMVDKAAKRIKENHGITYKTGTSYEVQGYLASGVSVDWTKKALNTAYVLTIELPDSGYYGYAVPPSQILPYCQATMDGLLDILAPQSRRFLRLHENAALNHQVCIEIVFLCNVFVYITTGAMNFS